MTKKVKCLSIMATSACVDFSGLVPEKNAIKILSNIHKLHILANKQRKFLGLKEDRLFVRIKRGEWITT